MVLAILVVRAADRAATAPRRGPCEPDDRDGARPAGPLACQTCHDPGENPDLVTIATIWSQFRTTGRVVLVILVARPPQPRRGWWADAGGDLAAQKGDERLCSMILKHYVQRRASTPGMRDPRIVPDQGDRLPYRCERVQAIWMISLWKLAGSLSVQPCFR